MRPFGRPRSPHFASPSVEPGSADRMHRWWRWGVVMALALALACSSSIVSGGRDLAITITATPASAAVNTPIEFRYDAAGPALSGILLAYGDGASDSIAALGATTAGGRRTHTYTAPGTFQVIATVIASNTDRRSDSISVEITP